MNQMPSYMTLGKCACAKPMMGLHSDARARLGQGGFSLVEAMISVLVVAVIVVAAMHTVGGSQAAQLKSAQRDMALMLAGDLMDEIMGELKEENLYFDTDEAMKKAMKKKNKKKKKVVVEEEEPMEEEQAPIIKKKKKITKA